MIYSEAAYIASRIGAGKDIDLRPITITQNGTFTPPKDSGIDGYNEITVNVSQGVLKPKTITANGTYHAADDNAYGFDPVNVNVSDRYAEGFADAVDYLNGEGGETGIPSGDGTISFPEGAVIIDGADGAGKVFNVVADPNTSCVDLDSGLALEWYCKLESWGQFAARYRIRDIFTNEEKAYIGARSIGGDDRWAAPGYCNITLVDGSTANVKYSYKWGYTLMGSPDSHTDYDDFNTADSYIVRFAKGTHFAVGKNPSYTAGSI